MASWDVAHSVSLPDAVKRSWDAHVFDRDDQVTVAADADQGLRERCARLIDHWQAAGGRPMRIASTVITVTGSRDTPTIVARSEVAGLEGLWPQAIFSDPRPIALVHGGLVARAALRWLVPLIAGEATHRDEYRPPILLELRLERRAAYALGTTRTADLTPLIGEYLIAPARRGTATMVAALWTSRLDDGEIARLDLLLAEAKRRVRLARPARAASATRDPEADAAWPGAAGPGAAWPSAAWPGAAR